MSNTVLNQDKLKADLELQTQQASNDASTGSITVDQVEVLQKVLGQRRGHQRGVGHKLKGSGSVPWTSSTQQSHFCYSQAPPEHSREYLESLVNDLKKLTDQVNYMS